PFLCLLCVRRPPCSSLFPYTTLFRSLVVNFFTIAIFYAVLEAQFLAAVQIIVYAGAIMVLFLFVIMLLGVGADREAIPRPAHRQDRKSTRLNSSHVSISYAVFCLKNK